MLLRNQSQLGSKQQQQQQQQPRRTIKYASSSNVSSSLAVSASFLRISLITGCILVVVFIFWSDRYVNVKLTTRITTPSSLEPHPPNLRTASSDFSGKEKVSHSLRLQKQQSLPVPPTPKISNVVNHTLEIATNRKEIKVIHRIPTAQRPDGGAFLHVGKTGGSSLSVLLRNGCHSYMPHPCRNITQQPETIASHLIHSYYHVPDFGLLPQSHHDFYLITVRDPLSRTISAFTYEHLRNRLARNETLGMNLYEKYETAYRCFPTLERWVQYLDVGPDGTPPETFSYPYPKQLVVADSCRDLARAALFGRVKIFSHLFFGFAKLKDLIPNAGSQVLYVTRQEHLWEDWNQINRMLAEESKTDHHVDPAHLVPSSSSSADLVLRNTTALVLRDMLPVTRDLSSNGQRILCRALQLEYIAYFWFLRHARNLPSESVAQAIRSAQEHCPNLGQQDITTMQ